MLHFLAPMLTGKGLKLLLIGAAALAIVATAFFAYRWVVNMQTQLLDQAKAIAIHQANEASYQAVIASKEARIAEAKAATEAANEARKKADLEIQVSRDRQKVLEAKLAKYDLVKHATRKPKLLEKAMERATQQVFDDFQALANQR